MSAAFVTDPAQPVYAISVAAELAGMHAQTLRQYDRLGIVTPSRTSGGGRRYSDDDVQRLRDVQQLSQEGISLAGIRRILELRKEISALSTQVDLLVAQLDRVPKQRVFAADSHGQIIALKPGQRPRGQRAAVLYRERALLPPPTRGR